MATAGSKEARQLERAKRMFDKAYKEMSKDDQTKSDSDIVKNNDVVKFKLSDNDSSIKKQLRENLGVISKMQPVANITYEDISHLNRAQKAEFIIEEYNKKFKGGIERQNFGFIELDKKLITGSLKYLYTDGEFAAFKALPQVLKRGKIISGHVEHKGRAVDTVTIAAPVVINGSIGYVGAVVKVGGKNKYHVHRILMPDGSEFCFKDNKKTEPTGVGVPIDKDSQRSTISSVINSISAKGAKNNTKYLLSDNQGRELTKKQQEYFKDSKVRDENGSLLTVYHGTNSDFTVFDRGKIGENYWQSGNSAYGGFYFTDKKSSAESYAALSTGLNGKGRVVESYLNITNPLIRETGRDAFEFFDDHSIELLQEADIAENDGIIIKGEKRNLYIAFNSEQIKNTDNTNPTSNPDIRLSLSNSNQDIAPTKDYRIYGKDIKLKDNIAPVNINKSETISKKETVNNIAPVNPNIAKAKPAPAEAEPKKSQSTDKPARPLLRTEMKSISRSIKRSYGSTFDPTKDIMRLYNAMHSGKLTDEEAAERATEIGRNIAENIKSKPMRTSEAQEVLDMLRNSRIKLDVEQISEVSKMYDGYNNYKQSI
ncbi:MAG: hypothetical protein ACI4LY_04925 [Candidatus Fimisoma sp.]